MLANQEMKLETLRRSDLSKLNRQMHMLQDSIRKYEIVSATQSGSIGTLESLRKEMDGKIRELEEQIEMLESQSASSTQNMSGKLKKKEEEISVLKGKVAQIQKTLDDEVVGLGTITGDLRPAMGLVDPNKYSIQSSREAVVVRLNEELLFAKSSGSKFSVSRLSSKGKELIASMAEVLARFPAIKMEVVGHTDNNKPSTGYSDNWTVSVIRAVSVTKEFVNENGLSASQVKASGKGEYAPQGSNTDKQGQMANRRVELVLKLAEENLVQKIRKITG